MADDNKMKSLEQKLGEIERIAQNLEQGSLPIDEAITAYAKAIDLVVDCRKSLDDMEQRITEAKARTRQDDSPPEE